MQADELASKVLQKLRVLPLTHEEQNEAEARQLLEIMRERLKPYVEHWNSHQLPTHKQSAARHDWTFAHAVHEVGWYTFHDALYKELCTVPEGGAVALLANLIIAAHDPGANRKCESFSQTGNRIPNLTHRNLNDHIASSLWYDLQIAANMLEQLQAGLGGVDTNGH